MAQESINEEIRWLEGQLEAKRKEAASGGRETPEKEIVREVIKDVSDEKAGPLPSAFALSDDDTKQKAYALQEKEHAHIIEELVVLALASGLSSALRVANSLKNSHILDELHDVLADKYYEKLLEARKLKA